MAVTNVVDCLDTCDRNVSHASGSCANCSRLIEGRSLQVDDRDVQVVCQVSFVFQVHRYLLTSLLYCADVILDCCGYLSQRATQDHNPLTSVIERQRVLDLVWWQRQDVVDQSFRFFDGSFPTHPIIIFFFSFSSNFIPCLIAAKNLTDSLSMQ